MANNKVVSKKLQTNQTRSPGDPNPVTSTICAACIKKFKGRKSEPVKLSLLNMEDPARAKVVARIEAQGIDLDGEYLLMDGHDNAFIGMIEQFGQPLRACYDLDKVIKNLIRDFKDMEDPEEGAWEWYGYNMLGAWMGPTTPVFLRRM